MSAMRLSKPSGEFLFHPGDECPGFVVVRSGCIRVSIASEGGREIVLYRVRPGEVCLQTFSCLIDGRRYQAEGVVEDDLDGELIAPAEFSRRMAGDEEFRQSVLSAVAHRFADFEHVVEMLAFAGLEQRVCEAVVNLAGDCDRLAITHDAIAVEIGSAREAVSRQISALGREGVIEARRGEIRILDRGRLERLAHRQV